MPRPSGSARRSTRTVSCSPRSRTTTTTSRPTLPSARRYHAHLRACIDAAAALGGVPVGTFIGRDPGRTVAENLREAERVFPPLVEYAGERGVRL